MTLEKTQTGPLSACQNSGCIGSILGAGVVTAGSVIVSGSIVIAANTIGRNYLI